MQTIELPTITDNIEDIEFLFGLYNRIIYSKDVIFNFAACKSITTLALVLISSLVELADSFENKTVRIETDSINSSLANLLSSKGFYNLFGINNSIPDKSETKMKIKLFHKGEQDDQQFIENVSLEIYTEWISENLFKQMDPDIRDGLITSIIEIIINANEHSNTKKGIFTCSHFDTDKEFFEICVLDFGVGIPFNVKRFLNNYSMPSVEGLNWALQKSNTTNAKRIQGARGMGLYLIKQLLVDKAESVCEIFSNDAAVIFDKKKTELYPLKQSLDGTLACIKIKYKRNV